MELEKQPLGGTSPPRCSRRLYGGVFGAAAIIAVIVVISTVGHEHSAPAPAPPTPAPPTPAPPTPAPTPVRQRWKFTTGNQVDSSPALNSDTVFVGSDDNNLYA